MARHETARAKLEARRSELGRRVGKIEGDLRRRPDPDSEERALERENDGVLEGLDARGVEELRAIDAALARIEAGTYGTCAECGEPIESRRLEAVPHTATCSACAG
jgi:RNA polymerase-binding transcription factor DksA